MKFHTKKRNKAPLTQTKIQRSLIFAVFFGVVMLIIGLSQLFAQSTVAFYLNPYYQSANVNEDRSLAITLSNNGQQVDGGSVKITYNPAQLALVTFNDPVSTQVGISNRVSAPGVYSYDFQIYYGSQTLPNLGTLVLKAKSLGSQQAAYIDFDPSVTKAYFVSNNSRSFYPAAHGRAVILINAAPVTQPPATTTSPPATTQPPTAQPPAATTTKPAPSTANNSPVANTSPAPSGPISIKDETVADNYVPPFANSESFASDPLSKPKRIAPIVFIITGVIVLALAGGAFIYLKYIRDLPIAVGISRSLHKGLFDPNSEPAPDEGIVITPATTSPSKHHTDLEPEHEAKTSPAIITKSKERAMHRHAAEELKKKVETHHVRPTDHPDKHANRPPTPVRPVVQHASHSPHNPEHPNHHESETITVSLHPHAAASPSAASHPAPPTVSQPVPAYSPPSTPPPLMPKITSYPAVKEVKTPPIDPGHHLPDWQTQLSTPRKEAHDDDPPDMFELAHDHPESFGSTQLYDVETKESEGHDKTQK